MQFDLGGLLSILSFLDERQSRVLFAGMFFIGILCFSVFLLVCTIFTSRNERR